FGFYYSQAQDWSAPGGAIWEGKHENDPVYPDAHWDARQRGDFETYFNTKALPQVREILSSYGPIAVVWFDTPLKVMTEERAGQLAKLVHELQPNCIVSGRLGGKFQSDYASEGDNKIPNLSRAGAWETPATLNDTWGFKKHDHNWKKPDDLLFKLVDIVSKGGNYLLNVGPDGEGVIPQPSQDMLRKVGAWLKINGAAVYGADRSPFGAEFGTASAPDAKGRTTFKPRNDWRCTTKAHVLYFTLFKWAGEKFVVAGVKGQAAKAWLLADPDRKPLALAQDGAQLTVTLPAAAPDPLASVLCVELAP
ncbi:MAG: alpha-L-fucosidase, partial [Kiritimatiellaeota bacterium]|nr:alpha-L-fucosidase [Kiritimatiellota bacterium]